MGETVESETFGKTCRYTLGPCIGRGAFGIVHKADITENGDYSGEQQAAVKVVYVQKGFNENNDNHTKTVARLRKILHLEHDHLVTYHQINVTNPSEMITEYSLLMDFYADGDLTAHLERLRHNAVSLDLSTVICYAVQLANGVAYLHTNKFVHGDLKPSNILMKHKEKRHSTLLIGDLDDLTMMHHSVTTARDITSLRGTLSYMSPEMLQKFVHGTTDESIGRKSDIWSLGCVVLELVNFSCDRYGKWLHNQKTSETIQITAFTTGLRILQLIAAGWVPFTDSSAPQPFSECIQECLRTLGESRIPAVHFGEKVRALRNCATSPASALVSEECHCMVQKPAEDQVFDNQFKDDGSDDELWESSGTCLYDALNSCYQYHIPHMEWVFGTTNVMRFCSGLSKLSGRDLNEESLRAAIEDDYDKRFLPATNSIPRSSSFFRRLTSLQHLNLFPLQESLVNKRGELYSSSQGESLICFLDKQRQNKTYLTATVLVNFAHQLADGLRFLHKNGIFCGFLEPHNVCITTIGNAQYALAIDVWENYQRRRDIEMSYKSYQDLLRDGWCYMAPEVIRRVADPIGATVGFRADIWSFGAIILQAASSSIGLYEQWIYNDVTQERRKVTRNARDLLMDLDNNFKPYIHHTIPKFLATCIRDTYYLIPFSRLSAEEMFIKLSDSSQRVQCNTETESLKYESLKSSSALATHNAGEGNSSALLSSNLSTDANSGNRRSNQKEVIVSVACEKDHYRYLVTALIFDPSAATLRQSQSVKQLVGVDIMANFELLHNNIVCHIINRSPNVQTIAWDVLGETWFHLCSSTSFANYRGHSSVAVNDSVYFWCFGYGDEEALLHELNLWNGNIQRIRVNTWCCGDAKLVAFGNKIICCANSCRERWVVCFDTQTREWESFPEMPEARSQYAVVQVGKSIYILGGWGMEEITATELREMSMQSCFRLDILTRCWERIGDLTFPSCNNLATVCNGAIFVIRNGAFATLTMDNMLESQVETFDPERNVWVVVEFRLEKESAGSYSYATKVYSACFPVDNRASDEYLAARISDHKNTE